MHAQVGSAAWHAAMPLHLGKAAQGKPGRVEGSLTPRLALPFLVRRMASCCMPWAWRKRGLARLQLHSRTSGRNSSGSGGSGGTVLSRRQPAGAPFVIYVQPPRLAAEPPPLHDALPMYTCVPTSPFLPLSDTHCPSSPTMAPHPAVPHSQCQVFYTRKKGIAVSVMTPMPPAPRPCGDR